MLPNRFEQSLAVLVFLLVAVDLFHLVARKRLQRALDLRDRLVLVILDR